ncbi:hypothetical protein NM688_g1168 [Phlebia brevispora]|uniref:Uncharacterized protein n=1 Tax=Phlebia brevispora TaxID=194682 RepID=A0ACC1TCI4_9APHY|nr:hypothetical protein NM688_g1168 [Phlebia brevispora]
METLPPEIHALIFSYACTFPATSVSLSLVSKYFREASEPYRWYCVSLNGYEQVVKFARTLQRQLQAKVNGAKGKCTIAGRKHNASHRSEATDKRIWPIYHLFVGDRDGHRYINCPSDCDPSHFSLQYASRYSQFPPALREILAYAAPSLVTLSFFSDSHSFEESVSSVMVVLSLAYPRLRELTLRAGCTPSQVMGPAELQTRHDCRMPMLGRLHLALPYHGFENGNLDATHRLVQTIAPRAFTAAQRDNSSDADGGADLSNSALSYLRFTMLDKWGSKRVVEVIHAELAESHIVSPSLALPAPPSDWDIPLTASASRVTWPRLVPPTISLFAIQPSPTSTFYCSCCMDLRGDVDVMRILERMAEVADKQRFLYLDRRSIKIRKCRTDPMEVAGYGFAEAKMDWLERMQGEEGCWHAREGVESEDDSESSFHRSPIASPITVGKSRSARRARAMMSRVGDAFKKLKLW